MEFIEVSSVTVLIEKLDAQQKFSDLQCALINNQELGDVIPGSGGLRKVRIMKKTDEEGFNVDRLVESMKKVVAHLKNEKSEGVRCYTIPSPPKSISSSEIKTIREKLNVTQPVFAHLIGVSVETAKSWETGRRSPNATARKLLQVASKNPSVLMMQ